MAIKFIISSLDEVTEELRKEYKQKGDKFVLDLEDSSDERTVGLRNALSAKTNELNELKDKIKVFEGIDPKKYKEMTKQVEDLAGKVDEKDEAWKAKEALLQENFNKEISKVTDQMKSLQADYQKEVVESGLLRAVAAEKGRPHMLLPAMINRVKTEFGDDGKIKKTVLDVNGQPAQRYDEQTKSMVPFDYTDLVKEFKNSEDWQPAFEGSGASGSGGGQPNDGTPKISGKYTMDQLAEMSLDDFEVATTPGKN